MGKGRGPESKNSEWVMDEGTDNEEPLRKCFLGLIVQKLESLCLKVFY